METLYITSALMAWYAGHRSAISSVQSVSKSVSHLNNDLLIGTESRGLGQREEAMFVRPSPPARAGLRLDEEKATFTVDARHHRTPGSRNAPPRTFRQRDTET